MHIAQLHMFFFHTDIGTFMGPAGALTSFLLYMAGASIPSSCTFEIHSINQCKEKNHDHQSSHVNRYHDIMTIDHFDQNLLISKYHHFTNNHLLTSFC